MPKRDPVLDPLLGELQRLRGLLELEIHGLDSEQPLCPAQDRMVVHAREILCDAVELTDLLFWFGADIPADAGTGGPMAGLILLGFRSREPT